MHSSFSVASSGGSSQKNLGGWAPERQVNIVSPVAIISSRWKNWGRGGAAQKVGIVPPPRPRPRTATGRECRYINQADEAVLVYLLLLILSNS